LSTVIQTGCIPFCTFGTTSIPGSFSFDKGGNGKGESQNSIWKAREAFLILKGRKIDPDQEETYYYFGSASAFVFFTFHVTPI